MEEVGKRKVGVNRVLAHEEVITPDNVKQLSENIALYAIKRLYAYHATKQLDNLYYGLIKDIHNQQNPTYALSDGYDYAQTAICFLCDYIGKTLGTTIQVQYRNTVKNVTIIHACTSMLGRLYYESRQYAKYTVPIQRTGREKTVEPFEEDNREEQLGKVEEIIQGMHLSKKPALTLECYMQGMGITEITQVLGKCFSTIWRSRLQIQKKYMAFMEY